MAEREQPAGEQQTIENLAVVIPCFNDWTSLKKLVAEIGNQPAAQATRLHILIVDDASPIVAPSDLGAALPAKIASFKTIRLVYNMGHQRAIAIGLAIAARMDVDGVIVMDADGEDNPGDIPCLLAAARENPHTIICAGRTQRSENLLFRFFYAIYKRLFHLMTGALINFGNYCFVPGASLKELSNNPAIWSHFAAAICRSKQPYLSIPTRRAKRYDGKSRMNFAALIVHGLSAISVFTDVVMARMITGAVVVAGLSLAAIIGIIYVRLFTDLAIPGWASQISFMLFIVVMQAVILMTVAIFHYLSSQNAKPFLLSQQAEALIADRREIL